MKTLLTTLLLVTLCLKTSLGDIVVVDTASRVVDGDQVSVGDDQQFAAFLYNANEWDPNDESVDWGDSWTVSASGDGYLLDDGNGNKITITLLDSSNVDDVTALLNAQAFDPENTVNSLASDIANAIVAVHLGQADEWDWSDDDTNESENSMASPDQESENSMVDQNQEAENSVTDPNQDPNADSGSRRLANASPANNNNNNNNKKPAQGGNAPSKGNTTPPQGSGLLSALTLLENQTSIDLNTFSKQTGFLNGPNGVAYTSVSETNLSLKTKSTTIVGGIQKT